MAELGPKKIYSVEEMRRIAPRYQGKPENFDPIGRGRNRASRQAPRRTPQSAQPPPPTSRTQSKVTPQRNEAPVTVIASKQSFNANYSKLVDVVAEVYRGYKADECRLDQQLAREELAYYATALLQLKLLEVKEKQCDIALTSAEQGMLEAVLYDELNVPQPLHLYLQIGTTAYDKWGNENRLNIPDLPVTVVQNFGGYHAAAITEENHNLFEEVPSLGIAGDMLMALASPDAEPTPNFHIGRPTNTTFTDNLVGRFWPIGPRRPDIIQRLAGWGITANSFHEYSPGTRFNLRYMRSLSDIIGKFKTYRNKKVTFRNVSTAGGETQIYQTKPFDSSEYEGWHNKSVQLVSVPTSSTAIMDASYCFGFQLYKEDGPGKDRNERTANWSCIVGIGQDPWEMPDPWYNNRNARRDLPDDSIGTERFIHQDFLLSQVIRRMTDVRHFK